MVKEQNHDSNWTSQCCLPANTGLRIFPHHPGPTNLYSGPNGAGNQPLIKAIDFPSCGKGPARSKDLSQVLQRVAYVEQKSAIDFHFPSRKSYHWVFFIPTFLSSRESKEDLQKWKCLETCQLDLADRQIFRRAIPTGADRPLLGPRSRCHLWMSPCRDWLREGRHHYADTKNSEKEGKTIPDRPSRPQQESQLTWPSPPPSS